MNEKDITIAGHGSNTPSLKNMNTYLESRYSQKASNGVRKGLVCVRRLKALTDDKRNDFRAKYAEILGRNIYSQDLRDYVYTPHNGKYYSDCSSSICATYKQIGYDVSNLNTAGIYTSKLFETVPVQIENGHVKDPENLKVGDCLLFAGNDPSRPLQIGHVEAVYTMPAKYKPLTWYSDDKGWWYTDKDGKYLQSTWCTINGHKYYFDSEGYMVTGCCKVDGIWYMFAPRDFSKAYEGALCVTDDKGILSLWELD